MANDSFAGKTAITDAGITACINAGLKGPLVRVSKVKIGSSLVNPTSTMTDIPDTVWEGDDSYIQYQLVDEHTFIFKVSLDESIGDFDIGSIGLFLEDGTLFSVSTLFGVIHKVANNPPAVVGNRQIFRVPIILAGNSANFNISVIKPDESSLPFVQTEASLPPYATAPFSVYSVIYHTGLKTSAIAIRTPNGWQFCSASESSSTSFDEGMFDQSVRYGDLVAFDAVSGTFKLANGFNVNRGYLGIRGSSNNIITCGTVINNNWDLTAGTNYYSGTGGGLTTEMNNYYVGRAINNNTLIVGNEKESINNKVNTIDFDNASTYKYPSEAAIVNSIGQNYAKRDMSNVGDVTFNGTVTFAKEIQGLAHRANWGDLAEYYYADKNYPEGTLVKFGGKKEITIADEKVNAVVTSKPAYLMNTAIANEENTLPIALLGRVPVRVIGKVKKFDDITISEIEGVGTVATSSYDRVIAKALEDKEEYDEGLVLCAIRMDF